MRGGICKSNNGGGESRGAYGYCCAGFVIRVGINDLVDLFGVTAWSMCVIYPLGLMFAFSPFFFF